MYAAFFVALHYLEIERRGRVSQLTGPTQMMLPAEPSLSFTAIGSLVFIS